MNQSETNYQKEMLTIDIVWANIFGFLILIPITVLFGIPYYLLWSDMYNISEFMDQLSPTFVFVSMAIIFIFMLLGIIVHELIHGVIWALYTEKGFKSIKFGVMWKMVTPYCHCKEPLKVKHYIYGALGPAIILGLAPAIIGLSIGDLRFLSFGIFFTMSAAGDFLVVNLIRKEKMENYVQDHPSEAGCYIYRKIES